MSMSQAITKLCTECSPSCSRLRTFVGNSSDRMLEETLFLRLGHFVCQEMMNNTADLVTKLYSTSISNESNASGKDTHGPSPGQVWFMGLLLVTVINACAFMGIVFLPLMKRKIYKLLLTYMVALAVGSLAGSALLVLIPDALDVAALTGNHVYLWKCTTVLVGVYGFFLLERLLKVFIERRVCRHESRTENDFALCPSMNIHREMGDNVVISDEMRTPPPWRPRLCNSSEEQDEEDNQPIATENRGICEDAFLRSDGGEVREHAISPPVVHNHACNLYEVPEHPDGDHLRNLFTSNNGRSPPEAPVAPVAWMIILGDGVHNFVDGLSLGAAFSKSIMMGISLSVAVICEELPHELGDFAVLLNSGMSMKKALLANFASACTCYLGFVVGVLMAELNDNSSWILALAGGMFLYISLVDMMPEVIRMYEMDEAASLGRWKVFLLQNFGLISGYCCIFFITLYGEVFEFK